MSATTGTENADPRKHSADFFAEYGNTYQDRLAANGGAFGSHMGSEEVERYHNASEAAELDPDGQSAIEQGAEAIGALKKTFEHWMLIALSVAIMRAQADRLGGHKVFQQLLESNGYGVLLRSKAGLTRLVQIAAREPEVRAWRETLTDDQRWEWASPSAIFKHCPIFAKPKDPSKVRKPTLEDAIVKLEEENHRLEEVIKSAALGDALEGDAQTIALMIVKRFSPATVREIAAAMIAQVDADALTTELVA